MATGVNSTVFFPTLEADNFSWQTTVRDDRHAGVLRWEVDRSKMKKSLYYGTSWSESVAQQRRL